MLVAPWRTPAEQALLRVIGARLKMRRVELDLTQEKLAELAGRHRTYIGGIERGERNPTILILAHIADALDMDVPGLFKTS